MDAFTPEAADLLRQRADLLNEIMNTDFIIICFVMVNLANVGFMMIEIGSINTRNNSILLFKNFIVSSISTITFFVIGFGLSMEAEGGLLGQRNFIGLSYGFEDYTTFVYYLSLCVMMANVATASIAERVSIDIYVFFSFITAGFIFPLGLAWNWNNGWLQ